MTEQEKIEDQKSQRITMVTELLKSVGIKMEVGGCGCCNSPWVKIEYNGASVCDEDNFNFSMFDQDKP